jgi:hypothetical protein
MKSMTNTTKPLHMPLLTLALVALAVRGPVAAHDTDGRRGEAEARVDALDVSTHGTPEGIAFEKSSFTLGIASALGIGQNNADHQAVDPFAEDQGNALVGVWEEVAPAEVDCQTRQPLGPTIRALLTFAQGGTMYVEDTFPLTGPYRTTGGGVWMRTSARHYTYGNLHYEFDPDKTFLLTIKQRSDLTLSRDGNSFTENGTFQGIDPAGNVLFGGCFAAGAMRPQF